MTSTAFADAVNEQIGHEYAAHQQYVAIAVFYDAQTLPHLAQFFYKQALEERGHAMMMVQYLLDQDSGPIIPGIEPPKVAFVDIAEPGAVGAAFLGGVAAGVCDRPGDDGVPRWPSST